MSELEDLRERVEELERWRDEIAERLGGLESDMRGVNEWVADTASVVAMADDGDPECDRSGPATAQLEARGVAEEAAWESPEWVKGRLDEW